MAVSVFVFSLTTIPVYLAEMSSSWQWPIGGTAGSILCKLKNYVMAVSLTVSIESLVWIALDRFGAVVWPMKFHLITSRFRSFAIASTWIVALTVNSADLYLSELLKENENIRCSEDKTCSLFLVIGYVRFAVLCIAPMILITIFILRYSSYHTEYNDIFLLSSFGLPVSSTTTPIICITVVESFRRGLREVFRLPQRKRLKSNAVKTRDNEGVTLRKITVLQDMWEPKSDIQP